MPKSLSGKLRSASNRQHLPKAQKSIDEQVAAKLEAERAALVAEEAKKARRLLDADLKQKADEITELQEVLLSRDTKLAEAQKAPGGTDPQAARAGRRQTRDGPDHRNAGAGIAGHGPRAKPSWRRKKVSRSRSRRKKRPSPAMQRQIEELKRRAEQGSQQLQGEVQELELESLLAHRLSRSTRSSRSPRANTAAT